MSPFIISTVNNLLLYYTVRLLTGDFYIVLGIDFRIYILRIYILIL
jgi:hypothetical protein